MSRKTFVLDTNVFLHDPEAVLKFADSHVVMPLVVLEELDKLKRFTDELGKNARHVLRFIDSLRGDLFRGVEVGRVRKSTLFSVCAEPVPEKSGSFPLPLHVSGHRILFVAHRLRKRGRGAVVVISKDFILRIKAGSIGIRAQNYESVTESFENLYRGFRREETEKRRIDTLMTTGWLREGRGPFFPNEFCRFTAGEEASVLSKYDRSRGCFALLSPRERSIWGVRPLNDEQQCAMHLLSDDSIKLVTLVGRAGTGKTLLALTVGLKKVFDESVYSRMLVSRPIMPLGKDIGFLPGTKEEKLYHWMQPIYDNLEVLFEASSGKESVSEVKKWVLESKKIEMEAVTFVRGRSLAHTYIIIDEAQNLTPHEVKTIISRAGKGTKVVLTGDPTQIDNPYLDKDSNALTYVVGKFKSYALYGQIFFDRTERSELAALATTIL
ncbi:MAG: PhoH family protein [Simkaniaceae bacterium]|nr:PhoH family protein [Simkaniaceae bacterium]